MAKVCLVYFDIKTGFNSGFHHGLAYMVSLLKRQGHTITFCHLRTENDIVQFNTIEHSEADVMGLSFTTNQKRYVRKLLQNDRLSSGLIVAGGVHPTLDQETVFTDFPHIKGICIGEGEIPLSELCTRLDRKEDPYSTQGFWFNTEERLIRNPPAKLLSVEELGFPDYSIFEYKDIVRNDCGTFSMMLARGCPYNCHYCCNHALKAIYDKSSKYVRIPSVDYALQIIKANLKLCPDTTKIAFADDTFTLNKRWVEEFSVKYRMEIGMPFVCNARVETINEQVCRSLSEAGCTCIEFGLESGSERLRRNVLNRRHSNQTIKHAFSMVKRFGMKRRTYNIVGFPFETDRMAKETLQLNKELQAEFGSCTYFFPYPGTKAYDMCHEHELLSSDIEELSGYLESPSVKEIFMEHKAAKKHMRNMKAYFYTQMILAKFKSAPIANSILSRLQPLLSRLLSRLFDPASEHKSFQSFYRTSKRLTSRYLRNTSTHPNE